MLKKYEKEIIEAGKKIGKIESNTSKLSYRLIEAKSCNEVAHIFLESCAKNNVFIDNNFISEMLSERLDYKDVAYCLVIGISNK